MFQTHHKKADKQTKSSVFFRKEKETDLKKLDP